MLFFKDLLFFQKFAGKAGQDLDTHTEQAHKKLN